jgi:outer membrane protein
MNNSIVKKLFIQTLGKIIDTNQKKNQEAVKNINSGTYSRVAHINLQALINEMPEVIEVQAQLEKLQKTYATEFKSLNKEYQTKFQTYSTDIQNQTKVTIQARQKELDGMKQNIQQYQQTATQDIQKKQADLLKPLYEKATAAIHKVAKAQGFNYVIDARNLIYANGKDLLQEVKNELGF